MTARRLTILTPLLLTAVGCSSIKSSDIETSGIYANYSATSTDGVSATATAILRAGDATSNTFVQLEAGDTVSVLSGKQSVTLAEVALGDLYSYVGALGSAPAGADITFDLERATGDSAPASTASMPDAFDLTGPVADTVYSRADDAITVTWDPSGSTDTVRVQLSGDCVYDTPVDLDGDPGTYTFEAGSLSVPEGSEGESCEGTVSVQRIRFGALDPALAAGGSVYAAQVRSVDIRLDP